MNKLTIQINNLEALERLIGGDSQVEIDIRNSVVQRFAEKHLKPLANSDFIKNTLSSIKEQIYAEVKNKVEKEIATFKTSYLGGITDIKLHPSIKQEIESQVKNTTNDTIRKAVDDTIKNNLTEAEISRIVAARFQYYTKDTVDREIKARLDKLKASL